MTATASAQKDFSYTTFNVPGAAVVGTKAFRGNARGDIVGRYFIGTNGPHGFLRKVDGTFTAPIDVPVTNTAYFLSSSGLLTEVDVPGAFPLGTSPVGINPRGNVIGEYFDANGEHGFVATK